MSKIVPFYVSAPPSVFNVMDYGAHADDATDDVAHVQAAITACVAAGGGTVYIPAGDYYFYAGHMNSGNSDMGLMVDVKSGVHLMGDGQGLTSIRANRANFHPVAADRATGIGVSDMTILVQDASEDAIKVYACDNVTVDHVTGGGASGALSYNGICIYGGNNVAVSDCVNAYCGNVGIHLSANAIGLASPSASYGTNLSATDCESHHCNYNFRTAGKITATTHRVDGVTYTRCNGHDAVNDDFLCTYADNIVVTDCHGTTAGRDHISFIGIHTGAVHGMTYSGTGGTAVHVDSSWGVGTYGASSGITED